MRRAVVSTTSGCAGLGLLHAESAWIADGAEAFAAGVILLLQSPELRKRLAENARVLAETQFDWQAIGRAQADLWRSI